MKKTLLCNIRMGIDATPLKYRSEDSSVAVSDTEVRYPISAMLEATLSEGDELDAVLIVKDSKTGRLDENLELCKAELTSVGEKTGTKIQFKTIVTEFEETRETHNKLLLDIIDNIEKNSNIMVDMTYGPKDQVLILFAALNFVERNYGCDIDDIIYGQVSFFENGKPQNARICEMAPLYYLNSITNTVECNTAEEAREMLEKVMNM